MKYLTACLLAIPLQASAYCFDSAASAYGVPAPLLRAIAQKESGLRADAIRHNKNGTRDIGLMQINIDTWQDDLAKFGITDAHLLDPCLNVSVGAWILARLIARHGMTWEAIGRYHSSTPGRKENYAIDIYRVLTRGPNG